MIRSGIAPVDELLGGLRPGATYLLTGGPGSGKSACGLQFAGAGLRRGERVGGYDRRLEPIVQSAAGVLRLSRDERGAHCLEALSLRHAAARAGVARFAVRPREGITVLAEPPDESLIAAARGPILLVH